MTRRASTFEVLDARAERYAAQPTLALRLRVGAGEQESVHAVALQCQIRIEPQRRRYEADEEDRLAELFGEPARWGETLRPFLWTNVGATIGGFVGSTEVDLFVPCTYDMEVAGTKYLHALADGSEVPLLLLFSGTSFARRGTAGSASPPSPGTRTPPTASRGGLAGRDGPLLPEQRVARRSAGRCSTRSRFKTSRALITWDQTLEALLKEAGEEV